MAPKYDSVAEVSESKETWSVLVRIVRLWQATAYTREKLPTSIEMVLMDTKGDKIHASVRRTLMYKFQRNLKEGSVFSLTNLGVAPNAGSYRPTRHPFKLTFQFGTKVKVADNTAVPANQFTLTPPIEVFRDDFNSDYLVDVMGMLSIVGLEKKIDRDGEKVKMIDIELNNDGFRFNCTLFGSYVDDLNCFVASGENNNAVVMLLFAKLKIFQGKPVLQNTRDASKLIFNPESSEANALRKQMTAISDSPYQVISQLQDSSRVGVTTDLMIEAQRTTIKALKEVKEQATFVVFGTIKLILNEDEWWYTACACHKKVMPDEKLYFCDKCNKHVLKVTPRYRIKVRVMDENKNAATFVIFDREAAVLFKKSCVDLLESIDMSSSEEALPKEISSLVDQSFLFMVDVEKETTPRFEKSFCVKKMTNDPDTLQRFKQSKSPECAGPAICMSDGSKPCLTTPESNINVAQDLLSKFSDTVVELGNSSNEKACIDLCNDTGECMVVKRIQPDDAADLPKSAPAKILKKDIKIEKD